jgi:hypothetical protein
MPFPGKIIGDVIQAWNAIFGGEMGNRHLASIFRLFCVIFDLDKPSLDVHPA